MDFHCCRRRRWEIREGPYPGGKKCSGSSSNGVGDGSRGCAPVRAGHGPNSCCRQYGGSGGGASSQGNISSSPRNGADGPASNHSIGGMEKTVGVVACPTYSLATAGAEGPAWCIAGISPFVAVVVAEGPAWCTGWLPWHAYPRRRFWRWFQAKKRRRGPLLASSSCRRWRLAARWRWVRGKRRFSLWRKRAIAKASDDRSLPAILTFPAMALCRSRQSEY